MQNNHNNKDFGTSKDQQNRDMGKGGKARHEQQKGQDMTKNAGQNQQGEQNKDNQTPRM